MHKNVWFWDDLAPVLMKFCHRYRVPFNEVVNRAVQSFLCVADVAELQLLAKRAALLHEESELRRTCSVMLRSGSYLPAYARKVLMEPGRPLGFLQDAQKPLKALNPREEQVFRKIVGRREEIARELAEIELELLKDVKPFRLKPEPHRSWSRARDRIKHEGGDNVGKTS
jgi:hypothetical protein